jgi:hypothetical protein
MAYTIRVNEEDEKCLVILTKTLNVRSVSKALLIAAKMLPETMEVLKLTKKKLEEKESKLKEISEAKIELKQAEKKLEKLLK